MRRILKVMRDRWPAFSIELPSVVNIQYELENTLLSDPCVLASLGSFSYSAVPAGMQYRFSVRAAYEPLDGKTPLFAVRDEFELLTALSLMMRRHTASSVIVIDNRSGFLKPTQVIREIKRLKEMSGEELELGQESSNTYSSRSFFNSRIIVMKISTEYFNTSKEINDLSCVIAEHAMITRRLAGSRPESMVNHIMHWFRKNVSYVQNNVIADHSAVGMFKNGTAVCQGIAAYAYRLMDYCGLDARYVGGEGDGGSGWGPHAWNMVRLDGRWVHVDFTFRLESFLPTAVENQNSFRRNHRWDTEKYSTANSDRIALRHKSLYSSVCSLIVNGSCFSVNGCVVVMPEGRPLAVNQQSVMIDYFEILSYLGGCYSLVGNIVKVYIHTKYYEVPLTAFSAISGSWYLPVEMVSRLGFRCIVNKDIITVNFNGHN